MSLKISKLDKVLQFQCLIILFLFSSILDIENSQVFGEESIPSEEGSNKFLEFTQKATEESEISFIPAGPQEITDTVSLLGEISLNEETLVHVKPRFAGTVKSVLKRQGDQVSAGDVLAVIQSNESLAAYQIKSETGGKVIGRNIVVGEFIKDDQEVFTIADLSKVWANAAAYESSISKLKVGMPVTIKSQTRQLEQKSSINYLDAFLIKPSRSQNVRITLENSNFEWIPGMFINASVITEKHTVSCAISTTALNTIDNKSSVFVKTKKDGKEGFEVREVTVGRSDSHFSEIIKGVSQGELVATENSFVLKAELEKGSAD